MQNLSSRDFPTLRWRFAARADVLRTIRAAIRGAAEHFGCKPPCASDVVHAVDEACQNIIRHGYGSGPPGDIEIDVRREGQSLVVLLRDYAPSVPVERVRPRELDDVRPGGLGTHFIREIMDESEFLPPPGGIGNLLRLSKRIS